MSLSSFLVRTKNLFDLEDVNDAKRNLGIGSIAVFDSNNVKIDGGSIIANSFALNTNNARNNAFLKCIDNSGNCDWHYIPSFEWLTPNQTHILLSEFSNDCIFVRKSSLCNIAFTGNIQDVDFPPNLEDYYINDNLTQKLLMKESNLSDLDNIEQARNNLGLGDIALQNSNMLYVDNITIRDNITFTNQQFNHNEFLYLSNNILITKPLPLATPDTNEYGVVKISTANVDDPNTVPTSSLVYNELSNLEHIIHTNTNIINNNDLIALLSSVNVLISSNNLSDVNNKVHARSNLGLGTLSLQDSNNVSISNLIVDSFSLHTNAIDGRFLKTDSLGNAQWDDLPIASTTNYGIVLTTSNIYSHDESTTTHDIVPTAFAISNLYADITANIQNFNDNILTDITQLSNHELFIRRESNLSDLTNVSHARSNLELHDIAHTGNYNVLSNTPTHLQEFSNDMYFLTANCNLNELTTNSAQVRHNLGLGSMATQNSNNVHITGGAAMFSNVIVTDTLMYRTNENAQNKILKSIDHTGRVSWCDFPIASSTDFGAVKISHDENSSNDDVVPSCYLLQKMYNNLLKEIIREIV